MAAVVRCTTALTAVHSTTTFCVQVLEFMSIQVETLTCWWNIMMNTMFNFLDINLMEIKIDMMETKISRIVV